MVRTQDGFELAELDLRCAGRASSLGRGRRVCRIFAWQICCETASCWNWPSRRRRGLQISRRPRLTEAERARVWARLKECVAAALWTG